MSYEENESLNMKADSAASPAAQPPYRLFSEVEIHEAIDKATEVFSGVLNELQRDQISVDTVKNLRSPAAQQEVNSSELLPCSTCNGTGKEGIGCAINAPLFRRTCPDCFGTGKRKMRDG